MARFTLFFAAFLLLAVVTRAQYPAVDEDDESVGADDYDYEAAQHARQAQGGGPGSAQARQMSPEEVRFITGEGNTRPSAQRVAPRARHSPGLLQRVDFLTHPTPTLTRSNNSSSS